jgi:para-nitrobenzyl esterase
MPAQTLLDEAGPRFRFWPHIDGYFLSATPESVFRSGAQARVPLLVGMNSHEGPMELVLNGSEPTPENWRDALASLFGERANEALEHYPGNDADQVARSNLALATDLFVGHSVRRWMNLHRMTSGTPLYFYRYTHPHPAPVPGSTEQAGTQPRAAGAAHGVEVEYVLGNLDRETRYAWTQDDHKVAQTFSGYIERFVKTGDPNRLNEGDMTHSIPGNEASARTALPHWPAVRSGAKRIAQQSIGVQTATEWVDDAARHAFMQSFFEARLKDE